MQTAAHWEEKASNQGARMDMVRTEEEKRAAEEADLARRRQLLSAKLRQEEEEHKQALLERQVTGNHRLHNMCSLLRHLHAAQLHSYSARL